MAGIEHLKPLCLAVMVATASSTALAQNAPQDGIDRNLLERQQREADFHVRLFDEPVGNRSATPATAPLVPESFSKRESFAAPPPQSTPRVGSPPVVQNGAAGRQTLEDSQLRRQLELQSRTGLQDPLGRQPDSQIQQLQFGRENQAQQLQQQIQRDSNSFMRGLR